MWPTIFNTKHSDWKIALQYLRTKYGEVAQHEIVPILERKLETNDKVTSLSYTDFTTYIESARSGNQEHLKAIEYTYFLHRILDELILVWVAKVISGESKINAISQITRAIIADLPINEYAVIEKIFDQLGAEQYLQTLFLKEMQNKL